ncbi:TPA: virulence promoting factor [Escherichia coli]|nr:virulence promoting factor [Escherichia coli]HDV9271378.1 virulence promoting factor [Escherichia coli]
MVVNCFTLNKII